MRFYPNACWKGNARIKKVWLAHFWHWLISSGLKFRWFKARSTKSKGLIGPPWVANILIFMVLCSYLVLNILNWVGGRDEYAYYNPYQIHYYTVRTVLKRCVGRRHKKPPPLYVAYARIPLWIKFFLRRIINVHFKCLFFQEHLRTKRRALWRKNRTIYVHFFIQEKARKLNMAS